MEEEKPPIKKRIYVKKTKVEEVKDIEVPEPQPVPITTAQEPPSKRVYIKKSKIVVLDSIPEPEPQSEPENPILEKPKRKYTKKADKETSEKEEKPKKSTTKKPIPPPPSELVVNSLITEFVELKIEEPVILEKKRTRDDFNDLPELIELKNSIENISESERYNILHKYYEENRMKREKKIKLQNQIIYKNYTINNETDKTPDIYMYILVDYVTGHPPPEGMQGLLRVSSTSKFTEENINILSSCFINSENKVYKVSLIDNIGDLTGFESYFFICNSGEESFMEIINRSDEILKRNHCIDGFKTIDIITELFNKK